MTVAVPPNLFQRINAVRNDVSYVQKTAAIDGKYRAVTHDAVVAAIRGAMIEHGVIAFPSLTSSSVNEVTKADGSRSTQFRYEGTYQVTFLNADDPEEREVVTVEGHAMDNADKAPGKATSYAFKNALLKMFLLETGENEESVFGGEGMDNTRLGEHFKAIAAATNAVELHDAVAAAIAEADEANDKQAIKLILRSRDAREASMPIPISDADFQKGMTKWTAAITSGKKTAEEIITSLKSKRWIPSQEQEAAIRSIGKEEQQ